MATNKPQSKPPPKTPKAPTPKKSSRPESPEFATEGRGIGLDFVTNYPEIRDAYRRALDKIRPKGGRPPKYKPPAVAIENPLELEAEIEQQLELIPDSDIL